MKPSEAVMNKFYQNIGKLFYAVAAVDLTVEQEETAQLKKIIREEWLSLDEATDSFGTDSAFQIEIVFDWLLEKQPGSQESFNRFKTFMKEHAYLFTEPYKNMIVKTASSIADSFYGKNKSELTILTELNTLMKQN